MKTTPTAPNYKGYRFPPEIISHCVWFYFRFSLSFRDIEEIMAERGVIVTVLARKLASPCATGRF
jgi:putative transposase